MGKGLEMKKELFLHGFEDRKNKIQRKKIRQKALVIRLLFLFLLCVISFYLGKGFWFLIMTF